MQYEELLELAKGRRTIRAIKPDPVPDECVEKALEVARWAPTGFNMQPAEFMVLNDPEKRAAVKKIIDDWIEDDFYVLEATREPWQGPPWTLENRGRVACPAAPVVHPHRGGHPPPGRAADERAVLHAEGDSIFESSLANAFVYLWLGLHSLGLGAQPVSAVKNERPQALIKQYLGLPELHLRLRDAGRGVQRAGGGAAGQAHAPLRRGGARRPAAGGVFLSEEEVRKQIRKLRMGNVARHAEASRVRSRGYGL